MRPRAEASIAVVILIGAAVVAALLGRSSGEPTEVDRRPSTFLAGPDGSRGLLEALQRMGLAVRRFRQRSIGLDSLPLSPGEPELLVILDPTAPLSPSDRSVVLRFALRADLLLAGPSAEPLMRCFGYRVDRRFAEPVPVVRPGTSPRPDDPAIRHVLVRTFEQRSVDSTRVSDWGPFGCDVPEVQEERRLLVTPGGEAGAVEVRVSGGVRRVFLIGDVDLIRNRALRQTTAGPFVLSLIADGYNRVLFEEYHHFFGASGSLAGAALEWSRRSPWGWLAWQLAAVGMVGLLFSAVRFGPARAGITRTRRSPLEHVRALAVALSAARGHDEAIGAMVRGLRRRLLGPGMPVRSEWKVWLEGLPSQALSPQAREALDTLRTLTRSGQPASSVRRAANAVEDLWQELRPPPSH